MSIKLLRETVSSGTRAEIVKALETKITELEAAAKIAQLAVEDARALLGEFKGTAVVLQKKGEVEVRAAKRARKSASTPSTPKAKAKKSAQLASQQLQGQYLGKLRRVPENRRAHFQKIARTEGRAAAIKALDQYFAKR